jgi:hypothetical protein
MDLQATLGQWLLEALGNFYGSIEVFGEVFEIVHVA